MKILAFAATNSRNSINRSLVEFAAARLQSQVTPETEVEFAGLNDFEVPIYSIDRETQDGILQEARTFFDEIGAADAVLVSFAEHNGSVTAAWKNIFDWMSRIDMEIRHNKPVAMLAATPGPRADADVLGGQEHMAPFFGADLRGVQGIGNWAEAWGKANRTLLQADDIAALDAVLNAPAAAPAIEGEVA